MSEFDKSKWHTQGWKHNPEGDEPELMHSCNGYSYPQFCDFLDEQGNHHLISRVAAVALGLIGLADSPDRQMTWEEYRKLKEKR